MRLFLAILILALVAVNGQPHLRRHDSRIVSGIQAYSGQMPWQVSFQTGSDFHFCGGSLVTMQWVLTAAHCVDETTDNPNSYHVEAGMVILGAGSKEDVIATVRHANYNPNTKENDIAMLYLRNPFLGDRFKAVKLHSGIDWAQGDFSVTFPGDPTDCNGGDHFYVSGYGTTTAGGSPSNELLWTNVCYVSDATCNGPGEPAGPLAGYHGNIFPSMICAGGVGGEHDSCQGDSGGPMMQVQRGITIPSSENDEQVGIVSWGSGCATTGKPGVYTEVSYFRNWIIFVESCYPGNVIDMCDCSIGVDTC